MHQKPARFPLLLATPRSVVRTLFYCMVAPLIYKESGIVTTVLLGMLSIELALKGDWIAGIHGISMRMTEKIKDLYDFQNNFVDERAKKSKRYESDNRTDK